MSYYVEAITDEVTGLAVSGAEVFVYDDDNNLATLYAADGTTEVDNPLATNADGEFSFYSPTTELTAVVYYGGRLRRRLRLLVGGGYSLLAAGSAQASLAGSGALAAANTGAGLAGTAIGETFWLNNGDGTGATYRHDVGPVATEISKFIIDPTDTGAAGLIGFIQSGDDAVSRTMEAKARDVVSVMDFGAVGDGSISDGAAINLALAANAGGTVVIPRPPVRYKIETQIVIPDDTDLIIVGWGIELRRAFNGDMVSLGKRATISGGVLNGVKASTTGAGVVIASGENVPTPTSQGLQLVDDMMFVDFPDYPVKYTTANRGWMSEVRGCGFQGTASDAAVKWPDEATSGGNRTVTLCYSDVAIVNTGGCDNGIISFNTTGGSATTNQGVVFPSGTTNRAKKVIVIGNRFAIAGGSINIRGLDHIFSGNIVAGDVVFQSNGSSDGASGVTWDDSNSYTGTLTDSSGTANKITFNTPVNFTPTITPASGSFSVGNADVRGEYTRENNHITANYFITMGSTTTYGTGAWTVSIPVNRYGSGTTDFIGSAMAQNQACVARTLFAVSTDGLQVLTSGGSAVGASTPSAWGNGNVLMISIRYRIF